MRKFLMSFAGFSALALWGAAACADAPRVVTDIAPVEALVAEVMAGTGAPARLVDHGASPHAYNLRPSEAAALENVDVIFLVTPALTPWLPEAIAALAPEAQVEALLEAPGVMVLTGRETALFGGEQADDHSEDHSDEHGDDHGDDRAGVDDHNHDHGHDGPDPHAWLDPDNAAAWVTQIAITLSAQDPENAGLYAANADAARARLAQVSERIQAQMAPHGEAAFVVFHDAYQYFERAADVRAAGAIALSDARAPGPARVATIRDAVAQGDIVCVFAEPQFNLDLAETVIEGTGARLAVLDPLGSDLAPGPGFLSALLEDLSARMADCLGG